MFARADGATSDVVGLPTEWVTFEERLPLALPAQLEPHRLTGRRGCRPPTRCNLVNESQSDTTDARLRRSVLHLWQHGRVVANFDPQPLAESVVVGDELPGCERVSHDIRDELARQQH